jgi:hypothetical protein
MRKHYTKTQRAELIDLGDERPDDHAESRCPARRCRAYRILLAQARQRAARACSSTDQVSELRRVLETGELPLDNTRAERALRKIVVGRKAWMFYGSDTHAEAAAAIFSVIASCRLHALDPFHYLEEILRVVPYWLRSRYLELAPKYWHTTRGRLRPEELAGPLSAFEVPPPLGETMEFGAA